ncbi:hypothetical protein STRDD11_00030 [Streptococcus sp. DD11]|nr:hypothetical protein STRDD11_00030 [Streptococcus sp. DD11]
MDLFSLSQETAKAGMCYEGTFRQAVYHKGEIKDFSVYGILQSDLQRKS